MLGRMGHSAHDRASPQAERAGEARADLGEPDWWLAAAVGALEDHVYFGLLQADASYQDLFVGPNLERLLVGEPQSDAHWRSRIEPADLPSYRACEAELLAGRPAQVDYRVHGLDGLRVIDASIMPRMISANLNASTLMIADKAADMIRGRRLPEAVLTSNL